ncbi:MAG: phosphate acyltransferase PlsX [Ignavibacteriaceae bacterium]|nr:phosphate acyltransferase PlsX [Ignavibacteriaceae bacterium]
MGSGSPSKFRIVLDAMGGDFSPVNEVLAAGEIFKNHTDIDLVLTGDKQAILKTMAEKGVSFPQEKIIHASQKIDMSDSPVASLKKKPDSSISVGCKYVAEGNAEAFVSAGNTGAVVTASTFILGRIEGVERPTMGTFFPSESSVSTIFDVGAFVDSKPQHLLGFARMSTIYVREIYNIASPSIGLLTVGEESEKGGKTIKETHTLLKDSGLNFFGNIEGRDILKGSVNIVLCDGFVGNIVLKFGESFPKYLKTLLKEYASRSFLNKLKVLIVRSVLRQALSPLDYQYYGGVLLLGVKSVSIIGHGSSTPLAITNMVLRAKDCIEKDVVKKISAAIAESPMKESE